MGDYILIFFIVFYLGIIVVSLAFGVLQIIAQWKLFEKAGEYGWASLIPIYNYFVMIKTATGSYTLAWIYIAISIVCGLLTSAMGFIVEFYPDEEAGGIAYILIMLAAFGLMIPLYVILGYTNYMFGKSYGKPPVWNVCMIFIGQILMIIMGFDKKTVYIGPKGIPKNYT
ncbi:MAG: DUF5684 domain-containing protein [Ruminococcus flavefaciens]|nr:DUF5684 domain-containing protein [Ruminococcus flavefaciens]MCM1228542.1 DUF5684 domain-containing protein [Ruminococcus flavefaciens]